MSFMSDLTDSITGGSNKKASDALAAALGQINAIETPTAQQLQMTPLAQYVSAGQLAPAQTQAASTGPSAFNAENLSSVPNETMQRVLAREEALAESNGMTPQERARIAQAESEMNRNVAGQRGAIEQSFAGRGVPQSLIAAALENGTVGQNSQQGYENALNAEASAANNALNANTNAGALAGQMFQQNAGQANTVAQAQNALNEFNAANTQQANLANQATQQGANTYNATNAQNISNENVTGQHEVQRQNQVGAPQQAASLALQKIPGIAEIGKSQANQDTAAGQQAAGLFGGILGAGASLGSAGIGAGATNNLANAIRAADGGEIPQPVVPPTAFIHGGAVPGHAVVPGNDERNDVVDAKLSPGEVVLPRTVAQNPGVQGSNINRFLAQKVPQVAAKMQPHTSDVASILKALTMLRQGA